MYPYLSDLFNDLLGTDIQLPMKTFGFFLALAFIAAYIALRSDLRRREGLGQFTLRPERIRKQGPMHIREVVIFALVWGLVGYKLGLMITDPEFFNTETEAALLSAKGFWLTGLLGIIIAGGFKYREYSKRKDLEEQFEEIQAGPSHYLGIIVTIAFVAGVGGAKLAAMLEPGSNFWNDPIGDLLSFNGLSFYGGLLLAGFLIILYVRRKGFHILTAVDAFAPALILAYAVGRIGCQLSGDGDWGIANPDPQPEWLSFLPEWTWSFDYPHNVAQDGVPIPGCEGPYCRRLDPPVWPTPIYETIMGLGIFGLLWGLRKKLPYAGMVTAIYLFLNGLERWSIEKIRVNGDYTILGIETTQAEFIGVLLMLGGIGIMAYSLKAKIALKGQSKAKT